MPAGYERPKYQSNAEKHKTNQQKHRENEAKAQPRTDRTASDHTKAKEPKKEEE